MNAHFRFWDHFADPSGKFGASTRTRPLWVPWTPSSHPWEPASQPPWESAAAPKGKHHTFFSGSWPHKSSLVGSSPLWTGSTFVCACVSQLQLKLKYWSQSHSALDVKSQFWEGAQSKFHLAQIPSTYARHLIHPVIEKLKRKVNFDVLWVQCCQEYLWFKPRNTILLWDFLEDWSDWSWNFYPLTRFS